MFDITLDLGTISLFLSTFGGFLSALAVNYTWDKIRMRIEGNKLLESVKHELQYNLKSLQSELKANKIYLGLYETSVWNGAALSGKIGALRGYKYLTNLAKVYSSIQASKEWDRLQAEVYFHPSTHKRDFEELCQFVMENRKALEAQIGETLALMKE